MSITLREAPPTRRIAAETAVVGVLVAFGFTLRLRLLGQGLWSDELIAYGDIHGKSFRGLLKALSEGVENSPPLYFVLAWMSSKLGSDPALLRLPSLVLGTAAIPLVYLLGVRTVGRWAGVVAAGFIALSPFAIHYAVEARPYTTLLFVSALSGLALLAALDRGGTARWAAWGLTVAGVLYSHYTGAAVVATELLWALWARPAARRELLTAAAIAGATFLPWVPFVKGEQLDVYGDIAHALGIGYPDAAVSWLVGLPFLGPGAVPGTLAVILLVGSVAVALAVAARPRRLDLRSPVALVAALALATPAAILLYSLVSYELFLFPRNLTASLPFVALLLAWALLRPGWPRAALPLALAATAVCIGTVKAELDRYSRPDYPQAAEFVDSVAGPNVSVNYNGTGLDAIRLRNALRMYYARPHRSVFSDAPEQWIAQRRSGRVVVVGLSPIGRPAPTLPPAPGLTKVRERRFTGISSIVVAVYRVEAG
jgi:4-amino-4-deoxy-L-arabinose transferase-like glycosyltransferase